MVLYFKNLSSNSLKPDFRCFLLVILFLSQVSSVWSSDNGLGIGFGRGHFDSAIHKTFSNSKFVKIKKKVLVENQFSARSWNLQRKQNIVDGVTTDVLANDNSSSNNSGNQESNSNNGRIGGNNGGGGSNNNSGSGGGSNQSLVSNAQPTTTGSSSSSSTSSSSTSSSSTSSSVTTTSSSSTGTTTTVTTTSDPGTTTTTTGAASTTETSSPPSSLSYSLTSTPTITSTGNPFLSNDPINTPNPTASVPAQSPSSISTSSSNDKSFFSRVFDKSNKLFPIAITVCVVGGIITILLGLGLLQCIIRSSFLRSEAKQEKKKLAQQPKTEDFLADIIARPPAGRIRNDNEQSIVSYGNMGRGTRIERVGEMRERERVGDDGRRIALGGATGSRNYMRMPEAPVEPFDSSRADPFVRPPPSPVPYQTPRQFQLPLPDPRNFTNPSQTSFDPRGRPSNRQFIPQTTPQRQSQQLNQVQRGFVPQGRPQPQFQPQIQPRPQFQPEVQPRPQFQPEVQPRSQFQPQVQPQAPLVQPQMYRGLQRDGTITYKPPPKKQISRNSTFIFPDTPPPPQAQLPSNVSNPYREADDNNRREFLYNYYYRTSSSSYGHRKSLSQKTASSGSFYQTSDPRSSSDNANRSFSIGVAEGGEEEVEDGGDPPMDKRRESQIRVKELNKKVRKGTLKKSR